MRRCSAFTDTGSCADKSAARTNSDMLRAASAILYLLLLAAWLIVAARTARGVVTGRLFRPVTPATQPAS